MATLMQNIKQSIQDFNNIKQSLIDKGIEVPEGTKTSEYAGLIENMPNGGLITDKLIFALQNIDFTNYSSSSMGQLGYASTMGLPIGVAERTLEVVDKCGTISNFIFFYGSSVNGKVFSLTQDEFVGYNNSCSYANMNEIIGTTRHIVVTVYDKNINIYVNSELTVSTTLSYSCSPSDSIVSLNSFLNMAPINTSDSHLYELRFYNKILTADEVKNNFNIFSQKYTFE